MSKKKHMPVPTKKDAIAINGKGKITVNYTASSVSVEEFEEEIKRIEESISRIRRMQYSTNVALQKVQSRKFSEITSKQLAQLLGIGKIQINRKR